IRSFGASVISELKIGDNATIKNIFGYRRIRSLLEFDLDGASPEVVEGTDRLGYHQYSDEIQLLGEAFDKRLDYIIGAYGFRESGTDPQVTTAFFSTKNNNLAAANKSYSVFGQATYKLDAARRLSITLGGRETWDKRHIDISAFASGVCL